MIPPISRCSLLAALTVSIAATPFAHNFLSPMSAQEAAFARGLFQMPPVRLTSQYFLVRAWEFECESMGVINKNPVAKTSVDNGLSEKGKKQAVRSAFDLNEMEACDKNCWIWPSISQSAYPAAEIIANGVSRRYMHQILFLQTKRLRRVRSVPQAGIIGLDLRRHRELSFAPEVRFVDTNSVPTYKQPASAVYKCLRPPNCN